MNGPVKKPPQSPVPSPQSPVPRSFVPLFLHGLGATTIPLSTLLLLPAWFFFFFYFLVAPSLLLLCSANRLPTVQPFGVMRSDGYSLVHLSQRRAVPPSLNQWLSISPPTKSWPPRPLSVTLSDSNDLRRAIGIRIVPIAFHHWSCSGAQVNVL